MSNEELEQVKACVDNEGFDYCFVNYSNFDEITDTKFHTLRRRYVEAQKRLSEYLGLED